MKKYLLYLAILSCFLLVGCGKYGEKDIVKDFNKKITNSDGYYLNGELEIINNEDSYLYDVEVAYQKDSYLYDVEVAYQKDNNFKVSLKNKTNNHEQIILKNNDGVYVMTHKSTQLL